MPKTIHPRRGGTGTPAGQPVAAIYARYSSEQQSAASIEDQHEVCRRYVERAGWTLGPCYDDAAISGASAMLRPAFQLLVADAEAGRFGVIVVEAIDRLGRNLADVAALFDRLVFWKIQVHAINLGQITQMHVGIMGTMAQMQLTDLRDRTRRGQLGRARAGRVPGGLAYGYEVVPPGPGVRGAGERRIKEHEAEVVRRIFRDYATGRAPRQIARDLNAERVPGPDGRAWIDTTLRGQADRGTGILNNTLYVGRLTWDRCSYVKDPRTGKRVARPNPESAWETVDVPELRIVDDELWAAVKARQAEMRFEVQQDDGGHALNRAHRRQFLLSGLLTCGCCGGGYTMVARDRYGCATRRGKGTCDNGRTIDRSRIETRVLDGIRNRLLAPDKVATFVRAQAEVLAAADREAGQQVIRAQAELADIERRLRGVLSAIEEGAFNASLRSRLDELEAAKRQAEAVIRSAAEVRPPARLHPASADVYREEVAELELALSDPEHRTEAAEALQKLVARVVLAPDDAAPDGLRAELYGDLAEIMSLPEGPRLRRAVSGGSDPVGRAGLLGTPVPGGRLSGVAGTRNYLDLLVRG